LPLQTSSMMSLSGCCQLAGTYLIWK